MKNNYSFFEQMLHRLSVGNSIFNEISFDIEKSIFLNKAKGIQPKIIFISGLARSGTTSLLNHLVNAGVGTSLTYNELPFLFMPNLSASFKGEKKVSDLKERAHGDSIFINEESPEAIDEIFWKNQLQNSYIKARELETHYIPKDVLIAYLNFVQLHLFKSGGGIYLTKNNNTLLRLKALKEQTVLDSHFVFAIRDPFSHAISLLKQHRQFTKVHQSDSFSLAYFNSLGHHEFGLNQKPFHFGDTSLNQALQASDPFQLDYWLLSWMNYYQYLRTLYTKNWQIVAFEDLCQHPNEIMESIFSKWNLKANKSFINSYEAPHYQDIKEEYSEDLLKECQELYHHWKQLCISIN